MQLQSAATRQLVLLPAVQACDRLAGELARLRDTLDVLPREYQQMLPYSHLDSAKALIEMAGEQVKKFALG